MKEDIAIVLDQQDRMMLVQDGDKEKRIRSSRQRKNGAFSRPKIIDFVGEPKHKNSVLNDCLLDDRNDFSSNNGELKLHTEPEATKTYSLERSRSYPTDESSHMHEHDSESFNFSKDYVEINNLIDNLLLEHSDINDETKLALQLQLKNNVKDLPDDSTDLKEKQQTYSKKEVGVNRVRISNNNQTHYVTREKERGRWMRGSRATNTQTCNVSRSKSLPAASGSNSKLPAFINALRTRRKQNIPNNANQSSDGEGSAQSMMSFESNSSSLSKRSRSGSVLSRLSRSSSSPMFDKRSRSGSLITNRTGCPQYFIPGENRGRMYMMPSIDLYETSSLCIKGIPFKIRRDMPRTHRAVSMVGCMGFVVPAPSNYFEK